MASPLGTRTGVSGSVTIPTPPNIAGTANIHFFEWNFDITREVFDNSSFDTPGNGRETVGGRYQGVGTARGTSDRADFTTIMDFATAHANPVAAFVLKEGDVLDSAAADIGDSDYTFSASISRITHTCVNSDRVFWNIEFQTSGEIVPGTL